MHTHTHTNKIYSSGSYVNNLMSELSRCAVDIGKVLVVCCSLSQHCIVAIFLSRSAKSCQYMSHCDLKSDTKFSIHKSHVTTYSTFTWVHVFSNIKGQNLQPSDAFFGHFVAKICFQPPQTPLLKLITVFLDSLTGLRGSGKDERDRQRRGGKGTDRERTQPKINPAYSLECEIHLLM